MHNKILAISKAELDCREFISCMKIITDNNELRMEEAITLVKEAREAKELEDLFSSQEANLSNILKETNQLLKILVEDKSSGQRWTKEQTNYVIDTIDLNNLLTIRNITDELNRRYNCGRTPFSVACKVIELLSNKKDIISENKMIISKKELCRLYDRIQELEGLQADLPAEPSPFGRKKPEGIDRIYDDEPF